MARDIRTTVVVDERSSALDRVARRLDRTSDDLEHFDRAMHHASDTSTELKRRLETLRESVHRLGAEYVAGDKSVLRDLTRDRRQLAQLLRIAEEQGIRLPRLFRGGGGGGHGHGGGGGGGWFGSGMDFSRSLSESRGVVIAGLVGLAIAASPAIGAAVAGAVTGAVGAGGIVGGVVAASTDARVQAAWRRLADSITVEDFAGPAFVAPTLQAVDELEKAFHDLDLGDALQQVAPYVTLLAKGIGDLAREFMPGFNDALKRAGPFIAVLGQELGETGAALGEMIKDMAESDGAIEGLIALFDALEGTLRFVGSASNKLADTWDVLTDVSEPVTDTIADIYEALDRFASKVPRILSPIAPVLELVFGTIGGRARMANKHFEEMNDAVAVGGRIAGQAAGDYNRINRELDPFGRYLAEAAQNADLMNRSLQELFGAQMDVDQTTLAWERDLLELDKRVRQHGRDLRINTEIGQENRQMILGQIQDAIRVRDAVLNETHSVEGANAAYREKIEILKEHLRRLGFTKQAIDDMVGDYEIRLTIDIKALVPKGLTFQGLPSFAQMEAAPKRPAYGRGPGARGRVLRPPSFAEGEVPSQHSYGEGPTPPPGSYPGAPPTRSNPRRQIPGFAHGGSPIMGVPYWVGEYGKELRFDTRPGYVMPHGQSMAYAAGGGSTLTIRVIHQDAGGRVLREELVRDAQRRGVPEVTVRAAYP